jgi:hypothetical protein
VSLHAYEMHGQISKVDTEEPFFPFEIEDWVGMLFVPFRVIVPSILRHGTQAHRSFGNDCITMLAGCPA